MNDQHRMKSMKMKLKKMQKLYINQETKNGELMIRNLFNFFQNEGSFAYLFIYDFY